MNSINDALIKLKIDKNLLGKNKDYTIDSYCKRDNVMNINSNDQIVNSLKKLGYYNIDQNNECNNYISNSVLLKNKNLDKSKTINELFDEFKQTSDYKNFVNNVNTRIGRALVLSSFINSGNLINFYDALTLEELNYLDW